MATHPKRPETVGLLLAGGAAKRLGGGDKGSREVAHKSLLAHVIDRLTPQCENLLISANGDAARFASFGLTVIPDQLPRPMGPLGGILAGLDHLSETNAAEWLLSAPVDCPFLPHDLSDKLHAARGDAKVAISRSAGQMHPVIALWHVSLRADLYRALAGEDVRKAAAFLARHPHVVVDWPVQPFDPFFNVNTPDDLTEAERIVRTNSTS